jgi:hypothetical protein
MTAEHRGLPVSRRQFVEGAGIAGLGLLAGCGRRPGQATPPAKMAHIGFLGSINLGDAQLEAVRQGLQEQNYVKAKISPSSGV